MALNRDFFVRDGHEIRAVGISKDGALMAIKEADDVRGMSLSGLIVSVHHRAWFKENEEMLREAFSNNLNHCGQIVVFGSTDTITEVF